MSKEMTYIKLLLLHSNTLKAWEKMSSGLFKIVIYKMFTIHLYLIYMYK